MALVLQRGCDADATRGLEVEAVCSSSGCRRRNIISKGRKKKNRLIRRSLFICFLWLFCLTSFSTVSSS